MSETGTRSGQEIDGEAILPVEGSAARGMGWESGSTTCHTEAHSTLASLSLRMIRSQTRHSGSLRDNPAKASMSSMICSRTRLIRVCALVAALVLLSIAVTHPSSPACVVLSCPMCLLHGDFRLSGQEWRQRETTALPGRNHASIQQIVGFARRNSHFTDWQGCPGAASQWDELARHVGGYAPGEAALSLLLQAVKQVGSMCTGEYMCVFGSRDQILRCRCARWRCGRSRGFPRGGDCQGRHRCGSQRQACVFDQ
jgi:hypothetical protein